VRPTAGHQEAHRRQAGERDLVPRRRGGKGGRTLLLLGRAQGGYTGRRSFVAAREAGVDLRDQDHHGRHRAGTESHRRTAAEAATGTSGSCDGCSCSCCDSSSTGGASARNSSRSDCSYPCRAAHSPCGCCGALQPRRCRCCWCCSCEGRAAASRGQGEAGCGCRQPSITEQCTRGNPRCCFHCCSSVVTCFSSCCCQSRRHSGCSGPRSSSSAGRQSEGRSGNCKWWGVSSPRRAIATGGQGQGGRRC